MTFENVETLRQIYCAREKQLWKRAGLIYLGLMCGGFVILIIYQIILGRVSSFFAGHPFYFLVMAAEMIVPSVFYLIIALLVISGKTKDERTAYEKAYRAYFVERVMQTAFTELYYRHEEGLSSYDLSATGMVNTGDGYSSNDYTRGKYKDLGFVQADVHIQQSYEDSDGNTQYETLFRGRFMFFEMPKKKFSSKLLVAGKGAGVASAPKRGKFTKLETESNEFNQRFTIMAEDGFEMFYLLDPAMMARIEAVADTYNDRVMFGFYQNKLMVGINDGKDSFEPPSGYKALDEKTELERNLADVKVITDLVDTLKLTTATENL